jgi:hypothetical protein
MTLITVKQDKYKVIKQASTCEDVYVTRGLGDCFVFGITYSGSGGNEALFGHFSQNFFKSSGLQPSPYFSSMMRELEGQANVRIEVVTNFDEGTVAAIKHVREALGEYGNTGTAKFYRAFLRQPYVDVYFFPKHSTVVASRGDIDQEDMGYWTSRKSHEDPRFCVAFADGPQKVKNSNCCVIL